MSKHTSIVASSMLHLILAIIAIYYGKEYLHDLCSDSFVHLSVWLIVQGSVILFVVVGKSVLKCLLGSLGDCLYWWVAGSYITFELVWVIMGGIILWRDSRDCKELSPTFYTVSMVVVIASIILFFGESVRNKKEMNEEDSKV